MIKVHPQGIFVTRQNTYYLLQLTHISYEVLWPLACINKVLGVVIVRVGTLSAFQEDVGVLVCAAILSKDLSYLLERGRRRERGGGREK